MKRLATIGKIGGVLIAQTAEATRVVLRVSACRFELTLRSSKKTAYIGVFEHGF